MNFTKKVGGLVIIIFLLSIFITTAKTEKITLKAGESYELEGKNISLVRSSEDYMIVCINGNKQIIKEDQWNSDVYFDLINLDRNEVTIKINTNCKENCFCDETCDNSKCLGEDKEEIIQEGNSEETNKKEETSESTIQTITLAPEIEKPNFIQTMIGISIFLVLLIVFLGALILRKNNRKIYKNKK